MKNWCDETGVTLCLLEKYLSGMLRALRTYTWGQGSAEDPKPKVASDQGLHRLQTWVSSKH